MKTNKSTNQGISISPTTTKKWLKAILICMACFLGVAVIIAGAIIFFVQKDNQKFKEFKTVKYTGTVSCLSRVDGRPNNDCSQYFGVYDGENTYAIQNLSSLRGVGSRTSNVDAYSVLFSKSEHSIVVEGKFVPANEYDSVGLGAYKDYDVSGVVHTCQINYYGGVSKLVC